MNENNIPTEGGAPRRVPRHDVVRRTPQRIAEIPPQQPTDAAQQPLPAQPENAAPRQPRPVQPGDTTPRQPRPAQPGDTAPRQPRPAQPGDTAPRQPRPAQQGDTAQRQPRPAQPGDTAPRQPRPVQQGNTAPRQPRPVQPGDTAQRRPQPAQQQRASSADGGVRRPPVGSQVRNMTSEDAPTRRAKKKRLSASIIVGRVLLVILTVILVLLFAVFALCGTLVNGPSETVRDKLVLSAMQASATKWLPGLFLDDEVVRDICDRSEQQQPVTVPMGTIPGANTPSTGEDTDTPGTGDDPTPPAPTDEWANAIDGMIFKTTTKPTFKAYILLIKDPSRVFVGTSSDNYQTATVGKNIFDTVARYDALAGINAGEYLDMGGGGDGAQPLGITYSKGSCVWDDGTWRTFIGFDKNNVLHAVEPLTRAQADELGIRDGVCFQNGNVLITNDGEQVTLHYSEGNTGLAQRTAIAQRADGTVILVVTDGRSPSSLGANRNDIIDLLVSEGAVVAGMLDGGSSAMMYYENYYTKYNIDPAELDDYQKKGLTNRYKSFTLPRTMPTFFLVGREK